jgi:hypothetical protein
MPLKIMCAGCSKDEREQAEALVRRALGARAQENSWTVSLVRVAGQWSVTLDAPAQGVRARNFMAADGRLGESILQALDGPSAAPSAAAAGIRPAAPSAKGSRSGNCRCGRCGKPYLVVYEAAPDEPEETVPVACPHCWQVNQVLVSESAAETRDYRAEKA